MGFELSTWFNNWPRLLDVAQGALFYFVFIIVVVRFLGKRATSQMNNFDWIVTVTVGSLAASGILLENVSIAEAAVAILIVAALQWIVTYAVSRSDRAAEFIKPAPRLLTHKGRWLDDALRKERVTRSEVAARLRAKGYVSVEDANWVILETDGSLTVIPKKDIGWAEAQDQLMEDVAGDPQSDSGPRASQPSN